MCQAFSCLITKSKKVYWKVGEDSHDELQGMFVKKDKELQDDKDAPDNTFARIEIVPKKGYLFPDKGWKFQIDERVKPSFWNKTYEKPCWLAHKKWMQNIYQFNLKEARKPINPFKIKPPKIGKSQIKLLKKWDSVWASVGASVRASVRNSVGNSIGNSVWNSVWDSVWASVGNLVWDSVWASVGASVRASVRNSVGNSVGNSVWAYNGHLFYPMIKKWKYAEKIKEKGYPFQSLVKLWKQGLVPSFDGKTWRLYGGRNAKILFEITKTKLQRLH